MNKETSIPYAMNKETSIPYAMNKETSIPKIIWTYWCQGIDNIPEFNKLCIETWMRKNPNYIIHVLDGNTILNFLNLDELPTYFFEIEPLQSRSDVARLALLNKFGGVWMDSSIICLRPLDEWLCSPILTGFAAPWFSLKNELDVFESWFIACNKNSYIIQTWNREYKKLWQNRKNNINIMEDPLFDGIQMKIGEYLNIHCTFIACMQRYPEFRQQYSKACIFDATDTAFIHYKKLEWEKNCASILPNDNKTIDYELINLLHYNKTPILKFTGAGCNNLFKTYGKNSLLQTSTLQQLLNF
jgi:hypothetical protein